MKRFLAQWFLFLFTAFTFIDGGAQVTTKITKSSEAILVDGKASEAIWKKSEGLGVLNDEGDDAFANFEGQHPGRFIRMLLC